MNALFAQLMLEIKDNKFDKMDLCHHYTSGMKSVYT